eukprot:gene195-4441_t
MKERETTKYIHEDYKPKHEEIYKFSEKFFTQDFLKTVKECKELIPLFEKDKKEFNNKRKDVLSNFLENEFKGIYYCEIFTVEFCSLLLEEVEHFESTVDVILRPNSMNNFGVILDELGLNNFFDTFIDEYFKYLSIVMSKDMNNIIDDHHSFIVEYSTIGKDDHLDFHVDDSELTINCCLGKIFKGGNLFFIGKENEPIKNEDYCELEHEIGTCILHDGKHRYYLN